MDEKSVGDWIVLVAAVVTIVGLPIAVWRSQAGDIKNRIRHFPDDRSYYIDKLKKRILIDSYRDQICKLNRKLFRIFGPINSIYTINICIEMAILYTSCLFLIGWIFGGLGSLGEIVVLPSGFSLGNRIIYVLSIIILAMTVVYSFKGRISRKEISRNMKYIWLGKNSHALRILRNDVTKIIFEWAVYVIVAALILIFSVFSFVYNTGIMYFLIVILSIYYIIILRSIAEMILMVIFLIVMQIVSYIAISIILSVYVKDHYLEITLRIISTILNRTTAEIVIILMVFIVLVPFANAVLDFISWSYTRFFLICAARAPAGVRGTMMLVGELIVDLFVGLACLAGLAALLPNVIEGLNAISRLVQSDIRIDWESYLVAAVTKPFSGGFFVTSMLLTTLLPTVIHLGYGLFGVLSAFTPSAKEALRILEAGEDRDSDITLSRVVRILQWRAMWHVPAFLIASIATLAFAYGVFHLAAPVGSLFASIAECSTWWSHGECTSPW